MHVSVRTPPLALSWVVRPQAAAVLPVGCALTPTPLLPLLLLLLLQVPGWCAWHPQGALQGPPGRLLHHGEAGGGVLSKGSAPLGFLPWTCGVTLTAAGWACWLVHALLLAVSRVQCWLKRARDREGHAADCTLTHAAMLCRAVLTCALLVFLRPLCVCPHRPWTCWAPACGTCGTARGRS
jgi:hypothetical protein